MTNTRFYTIKDVAEMLKVTTRTLFNWGKTGKVPPARREPISNYRIYTESDIEELKKQTGRG